MRSQMPVFEEILNWLSTEITTVRKETFWISEKDLRYVYEQLKLSDETGGQCKFVMNRGSMNKKCYEQKEALRSIRHPVKISGKSRPNIKLPNTCVAIWHHSKNKGGLQTPYKFVYITSEAPRNRMQSKLDKIRILSQVNKLARAWN